MSSKQQPGTKTSYQKQCIPGINIFPKGLVPAKKITDNIGVGYPTGRGGVVDIKRLHTGCGYSACPP